MLTWKKSNATNTTNFYLYQNDEPPLTNTGCLLNPGCKWINPRRMRARAHYLNRDFIIHAIPHHHYRQNFKLVSGRWSHPRWSHNFTFCSFADLIDYGLSFIPVTSRLWLTVKEGFNKKTPRALSRHLHYLQRVSTVPVFSVAVIWYSRFTNTLNTWRHIIKDHPLMQFYGNFVSMNILFTNLSHMKNMILYFVQNTFVTKKICGWNSAI